jgi:phenylpropionate dioxygenase-like ring-hydroxylating dioxygenase large terminal subunit
MIKNMWYAILDAKELKKGKLLGVKRLSERLVLWRNSDNTLSCIYDKCCHRGASLALGKLVDNHAECPFHGFQYNKNGKVDYIPANGKKYMVPARFKVNAFPVKEAYGYIWLWYGEMTENLPDIPFFNELRTGWSYGTFNENWPVHYTRAIENQLDVVHLPFVHASTIGRGNRKLVNGPVVKWKDSLMTFYVKNETDEGQTPQRPEEVFPYENLFHLQLQMPNTWQNIISDQVRIVAAFAPVDENNTRIYLRFYQKFMTTPVLRDIVGFMSNWSNKVILHQDRRVVLTQLPVKTELQMGENLIQGDLPIIEFRKKRAELKGE